MLMASYLISAIGAAYPNTCMADTKLGEALAVTIPEGDYLHPVDGPDVDVPGKDDPSTVAFLRGFTAENGPGADVSFPPWLLELLLQTTEGMMADQPDTTNYITMGLRHPETAELFEWVVSRPGRPGPAELRNRAEARLDPERIEAVERLARAMNPDWGTMGTRARRHRLTTARTVLEALRDDES